MRLARAAALILCAALGACASTSPEPASFTRADVVRGFELVAFGREFANRDVDHVIKFDHPVQVHVVHEPLDLRPVDGTRRVLDVIEGFHAHPAFERLTHAAIDEDQTELIDRADILVFAVGTDAYEYFHERASKRWIEDGRLAVSDHFYFNRCGANIADRDGRIHRAVVFLDVDEMSPELDECLTEEILQSLGLPDDDDSLPWSMFNDSNDVSRPGLYDNMLVSVLYSDRLTPGMSRREAMRLAPSIVEQLWPSHERAMARAAE